MLAKAQNSSTRNVIKRLLTPVIPVLFGVLVFAGTAQADPGGGSSAEPPATVEPAPAPAGPESGSGVPETTGTSGGDPESAFPAETDAPVESPPAESVAPVESPPAESVAPVETTPPPVETTPPPVETPAAEAPPPPEPTPPAEVSTPAEVAPPAEVSTPAEASPPASEAPAAEKSPETVHNSSSGEHEHGSETSTLLPATTLPGSGSGGSSGGEADALAAGALPLAPTGSEVVELGSQHGAGAEDAAPLSRERAQIEQRARQTRCELSVLGGPGASGCSGGWMSAVSATGSTSDSIVTVAAVLGATNLGSNEPTDPGGTAADGGRPVTPEPGPAPSGAGGGAAAGGSGGGVGLSGFLTLAGLLLLAAPRALRRLRLFCLPFLTAFFVLIPERPG